MFLANSYTIYLSLLKSNAGSMTKWKYWYIFKIALIKSNEELQLWKFKDSLLSIISDNLILFPLFSLFKITCISIQAKKQNQQFFKWVVHLFLLLFLHKLKGDLLKIWVSNIDLTYLCYNERCTILLFLIYLHKLFLPSSLVVPTYFNVLIHIKRVNLKQIIKQIICVQ